MNELLSKTLLAFAMLQAAEPAAATGLIGKLLGQKEELHALQLEQAADAEALAQARICKALGGKPALVSIKDSAEEARGIDCAGELAYKARVLMNKTPDMGAQLIVRIATSQPLESSELADRVASRFAELKVPEAECQNKVSSTEISFDCTGRGAGAVAASYRPNRYAPWTDVAAKRRAEHKEVFSEK